MPNIYRIRTEFAGATGTPWVSTQFFEALTAIGQAGADEAALKVDNFWSACSAIISSGVSVALDPVCDVLQETDGELVDSFGVGGAITAPAATGDVLPRANQGLGRLLTGQIRHGRRVQGRIFIPGPVELHNGAGVPNSTYLSTLETALDALTAVNVENALCVWHRPVFSGTPPVLTRAGEAITTNDKVASPAWAVLRSRRD